MKRKALYTNILMSILLQILALINGLVIPRIILSNFGSDVNGLVSSISQFLNYITLLEGGIGAVVMSALYRPLAEKDSNKVSAVLKSSQHFFGTIAKIFLIYSFVLAMLGPIFIWRGYDWKYTASLVMVLAANAFIQYYFSISYKLLLNSDQKNYLVSIVQMVFICINLFLAIIVTKFYPEIHILKIANAVAYCVQPIIFNYYVKRHYEIDKSVDEDREAIKQRWDGFGQNIAYVVHMNTDMVILTLFSNLSNVSIYAVYNLVVVALKNFVVAMSSAMLPSVANVYVRDNVKDSNRAFDYYELCIGFVTTVLYSCGSILVVKFVLIYTAGINDANYNQPLFGVLIMAATALGCIRDPYINIANAAGHFKKIAKFAYIEALINICLSIILVAKYGLIGVAIGTLVATVFRYFSQLYYLKKNVLFRSMRKGLKSLGCYIFVFVSSYYLVDTFFEFSTKSYLSWLGFAVITFCSVCLITALVILVFYHKEFAVIIKRRRNDT